MQKIQLAGIGETSICIDEPQQVSWNLLLAHGAGADMNHSFLSDLSEALSEQGFRVIRFNFPYKEQGKKLPGSPKEAVRSYQEMVRYASQTFPDQSLYISGKSYGGRMASHLLAETDSADFLVKGIIYFGFPLHPPGKPGVKRANHLSGIHQPQLFLQGDRDKLADLSLILEVTTPLQNTAVITIEGADHAFKVPKACGKSQQEIIHLLATKSVDWVKGNESIS